MKPCSRDTVTHAHTHTQNPHSYEASESFRIRGGQFFIDFFLHSGQLITLAPKYSDVSHTCKEYSVSRVTFWNTHVIIERWDAGKLWGGGSVDSSRCREPSCRVLTQPPTSRKVTREPEVRGLTLCCAGVGTGGATTTRRGGSKGGSASGRSASASARKNERAQARARARLGGDKGGGGD